MIRDLSEAITRRLTSMSNNHFDKVANYSNELDIDRWMSIYNNNPPWIEVDIDGNEVVSGQKLGATVVSKIATKSTVEIKSEVSGGVIADFISKPYEHLVSRTRQIVEQLLVQGGGILKPYINEVGEIDIQYFTHEEFTPLKFNGLGELTEVAFTETIGKGRHKRIKIETHCYNPDGSYIITNKVYKESGEELPLSHVDEWSKLEEEIPLFDIDKPFYVYLKTPFTNSIDFNSNLGVSIFSKIDILIRDYDRLYSSMMWEFQGSELEVFADNTLFKGLADSMGSKDSEGYQNQAKKRRLFRKFDNKSEGNGIDTFRPDIREQNYLNGLDAIERKIEDAAGLARGAISMHTQTAKTATEINSTQQDSQRTVKDIQKNIKQAYADIVEIMVAITKEYKLVEDDGQELEFVITFDDNIVFDKHENLEQLLKEYQAGLISREFYLQERFGITTEEAKEIAPSD